MVKVSRFALYLFLIFLNTKITRASLPKQNPNSLDLSKKENFSDIADGLSYKDLYKDYISIDQKWELFKKIKNGNPEFAQKVFLTCLKSSDWALRSGGLQFLASIEPQLAKVKALELFKNDPALLVRSAALQVLEQLDLKNHKQDLWLALKDSKNFHKGHSLWIRKEIAKNLILISEKSDTLAWSLLLNDKDQDVIHYSIQALEKNSGMILGQNNMSLDSKVKLWRKKFNL